MYFGIYCNIFFVSRFGQKHLLNTKTISITIIYCNIESTLSRSDQMTVAVLLQSSGSLSLARYSVSAHPFHIAGGPLPCMTGQRCNRSARASCHMSGPLRWRVGMVGSQQQQCSFRLPFINSKAWPSASTAGHTQ